MNRMRGPCKTLEGCRHCGCLSLTLALSRWQNVSVGQRDLRSRPCVVAASRLQHPLSQRDRAGARIPRSRTSPLEPMNPAARIPKRFNAFRDRNKPIRERFESLRTFMGSLHLPSHAHWGHEPPSSRASVLDCASPLALLDPPDLRKPKRQRTGAVQNLAALRRFMEREHLQKLDVSWAHEPEVPKSFEINRGTFRFMGRGKATLTAPGSANDSGIVRLHESSGRAGGLHIESAPILVAGYAP